MSNNLSLKRHSFAHIMAAAVKEMFPETQFGVGPVIENGCYYDFVLPRPLIPEDMPLLEDKIKALLKRNLVFKVQEVSLEKAIELFAELKQPLKLELLNDLATRGTTKLNQEEAEMFGLDPVDVKITIYRLEDEDSGEDLFVDLCRGPHIGSIKELRKIVDDVDGQEVVKDQPIGFKLDKFSAAYWRGDQARDIRMQRIYALVFDSKPELQEFVTQREEAKKRDHRLLNEKLKIFTISDLVGAGFALFQPKGAIIRRLLEDYLWQLHKNKGYQRVWTPHLAKIDLYKTSGHYEHYKENFRVIGKEEEFMVKPMNCPHHMQIFADNQFSYRDMPVRYFEPATVYRDEKSGQLSGLTRVRAITQDDGHLFCRVSQIEQEVATIVGIIKEFFNQMDMDQEYWVSLSVRDKENKKDYLGTDEVWEVAEAALERAAIANKLPYKRIEGEAAFYGPKLDFMFKDSIKREWQLSTIQCDFNLPNRFELSFVNEEGEKEQPVVIHRAISGALERFLGVYIEHTAGRFPFWLAPVQIKILTINDQVLPYVEKIKEVLRGTLLMKPLKYNEIRYEVDDRSESLGKKIREAEMQKIPMMIIVGPKDVEAGEVSVRTQEGEQKVKLEGLKAWVESL